MTPRGRGGGLVALMIALAVAMAIALSAMRLIVLANAEYQRAEQFALMEDQAAQAIDVIFRTLQQAGHVDAASAMPATPSRPLDGALDGLDNATVAASSPAASTPVPGAHLGSDLLAIHLAGDAAGNIRNCAGFSVPFPLNANDDSGISVFHVALDALGEPELRCKYRGSSQWSSQAIATGVESFQLLFGIDADDDGLPNDFVSPSRLDEMAAAAPASSPSMRTRIVAVHVSLLMRSPQPVATTGPAQAINLFGPLYAEHHQSDDPGTRIAPSRLDPRRLHRAFDAVIFLSNSLRPDA